LPIRFPRGVKTAIAIAVVTMSFGRIGFAASRTWDGGGGADTSWTDSGGINWNPDGVPASGDTLSLSASVPASMGIGASIGAASITFADGFNANNTSVIGGNSASPVTLTLDNGWSVSDNASSGQITFQPFNGGTGALDIKLNGGGTVTVASGADMRWTTGVGENATPASITKQGGGTFELGNSSGANTYSGGTIVDAGMLVTLQNQALGSTSAPLTLNGGNTRPNNFPTTVDLHGTAQTIGGLSGSPVNFVFGQLTNNLANSVATLTVGTGNASATFDGNIFGGQGTFALTKVGTGTQTIAGGANTYTGDTNINAGALEFAAQGSDAIGKVTVAAGATLIANEHGASLSIYGLDGQGNVVVNIPPMAVAHSLGFNLQQGAHDTFDGVISGGGEVNFGGGGSTATQTFTGANTYTGGTHIGIGTLFVNNTTGSGTGTGAVVVDTFGTLAGTGTISGAVTVGSNNGGGKISGGVTIGTLTLQNGLTFTGQMGSLATYLVDLNSTTSDDLVITGNLNLSDAFDQISFQGTAGAASYQVARFSGTLTGTFNTVTNLPAGYMLEYNPGQIDLVQTNVTEVPEPATWFVAALALLSTFSATQRPRSKTPTGGKLRVGSSRAER
jgi:fibronectin-binding autotransporter adhesin